MKMKMLPWPLTEDQDRKQIRDGVSRVVNDAPGVGVAVRGAVVVRGRAVQRVAQKQEAGAVQPDHGGGVGEGAQRQDDGY